MQAAKTMAQLASDPKIRAYMARNPARAKATLELMDVDGMRSGSGKDLPANIQEWEYFSNLSDEQKKQYIEMKRGQKLVELGGGGVGQLSFGGGINEIVSSEDASGKEADKASLIEEKKVGGKALGEAKEGLLYAETNYPVMVDFVSKMNSLNDKATYTLAGQAYDKVKTQLGFEPRESALARTEGLAMINNQVLPMLRRMLGAAFTEKEGERVLKLYGDENSSPQERKVALNALLETSQLELNRLRGYVGQANGKKTQPTTQPKQQGTVKPVTEMTDEELKAIVGG
jgi:hypothetical protein